MCREACRGNASDPNTENGRDVFLIHIFNIDKVQKRPLGQQWRDGSMIYLFSSLLLT